MHSVHIGVVLVAALTPACLSTNGYTSARTVAPGSFSHTIGTTVHAADVRTEGDLVNPIPMPGYMLRWGLTDEIDVGGQVNLPGHVRLDMKYNPLRTKWIDLSIAPAVWVALFPTTAGGRNDSAIAIGGDLPLIVDLNLAEWVSLVPFAGPSYARTVGVDYGALLLRGGLGVQFRIIDTIMLQPEVSTVIDPGRAEPIDAAFGLAIGFGSQPRFR